MLRRSTECSGVVARACRRLPPRPGRRFNFASSDQSRSGLKQAPSQFQSRRPPAWFGVAPDHFSVIETLTEPGYVLDNPRSPDRPSFLELRQAERLRIQNFAGSYEPRSHRAEKDL